jgi:DNA processing protein
VPASGVSACLECLRRSWLLGALSGRLEYLGRDVERLADLLELADEQLIRALGGKQTELLLERCAQLDSERLPLAEGVQRICRHDPGFPRALTRHSGTPRLLHVTGGVERMRELLSRPAVAIVGARSASDYGMEVAHGLGRGLAASGVTVVSGIAEGIAAAAHSGALQARGPTLTVAAGGVDVCHPASWHGLQHRLRTSGCVLAELPCGQRPRSWCHTARGRIVVALASAVVVVEARERPADMLHARLAQARGVPLAAVPGRVGSPAARGPHVLLRAGARLVRDAQDVLEVLYEAEGEPGDAPRAPTRASDAETRTPGERAILEQVGCGQDTVEKLIAAGAPEQETLVALARLELSGALVRGDAGRYVPRL